MPRAKNIRQMFDRVAGRYDLLNRVLSLGQDRRWRKALAREVGEGRLLDCCCGTGDAALAILGRDDPGRGDLYLVAADFSPAMCLAARGKLRRRYDFPRAWAVTGADSLTLPFADGVFDSAVVAFGVRNFVDLETGLAELARVIRPGGTLAVLEFAPPKGLFLRAVYRPYLALALPLAGLVLSGSPEAYRYLARSISSFLTPEEMLEVLRRCGFHAPRARRLTFGITCIYTAGR